jgi:hypothetical protein
MPVIRSLVILSLAVFVHPTSAAEPTPLSGTEILRWPEEDLSGRLMDGAHQFVERKIAESVKKRAELWHRDLTSPEAYVKSIEPNRQRFRTIIGAIDSRVPVRLETFGDDENPALVAEGATYEILQVRWAVLSGVFAEGLWIRQKSNSLRKVVAVPDASQTPEQLLGLAAGFSPEGQWARRLAENGFDLLIPTIIDREKLTTDDAQLRTSDQTHREWIYRRRLS